MNALQRADSFHCVIRIPRKKWLMDSSISHFRLCPFTADIAVPSNGSPGFRQRTSLSGHSIIANWIFIVIAEPAMMESSASREPSDSVETPVMP